MISAEMITEFATGLLPGLVTIGALLLLDFILGVTVALKEKKFEWAKVSQVLVTSWPKVVGWIVASFLGYLPVAIPEMADVLNAFGVSSLKVLGPSAYTVLIVGLAGSVLGHLKSLGVFGSVKLFGLPEVEQPKGEG